MSIDTMPMVESGSRGFFEGRARTRDVALEVAELDLPTCPSLLGYKVERLWLAPGLSIEEHESQYKDLIYSTTTAIRDIIEKITGSRDFARQMRAVLAEMCNNAYEHGNKKIPSKGITVAHKSTANRVDAIVIDEGGVLDPKFVSFLEEHRRLAPIRRPISFYQNGQAPEGHSGCGTSLIHMYSDEVHYFRSGSGGLAVQVVKKTK
jgi:anti-sigma regulatory factor (Ser/Thr protein kinase)